MKKQSLSIFIKKRHESLNNNNQKTPNESNDRQSALNITFEKLQRELSNLMIMFRG